jgi:hypothetical protein
MLKIPTALLLGACLALSPQAFAERMSKDAYKSEKNRISADYKADRKACRSMKANAGDVCMAEARAKKKIALADAEAAFQDTERARTKAQIVRAQEAYDVAKEKCDDQAGAARHQCRKDAEAAMTRAKGEAQTNRKSG